jgi:flagellar basal-body rod protein FlgG
MIRSLHTAATGMAAQQLNMDVIANNLANVNTRGFKKSRVDFQDLLYQTLRAAGSSQAQGVQVPTGIQVGLGTGGAATQKIFTQGEFQQTGNNLDISIAGQGFFEVTLPSGESAYTRDGSFKTDATGKIVTSDGYPVQPEMSIPQGTKEIQVGEDGTVSVIGADGTKQDLGQIQVVNFINPGGLESIGSNCFRKTDASGEATPGTPGQDGLGTLKSGFVEMANVQVVEEMVAMILAQRAYEINSKSIQTADEMLNIANNLRR